MTQYAPPSADDLKKLKDLLGKSSTEMAELFGVSSGSQWRKYMVADSPNKRDMGLHMLFYAAARLELDPPAIERVLNRMREIGATVEIDKP